MAKPKIAGMINPEEIWKVLSIDNEKVQPAQLLVPPILKEQYEKEMEKMKMKRSVLEQIEKAKRYFEQKAERSLNEQWQEEKVDKSRNELKEAIDRCVKECK